MHKIAIALVLAAASFAASADSRYWGASENVATTSFNSGIDLLVVFMPETGCNDAVFAIAGNNAISELAVNIDGEIYTGSLDASNRLSRGVGFVASDSFLYALKSGYEAYLVTDQGSLGMTLNGSAAAINSAWRYCEATVNATYNRTLRANIAPSPITPSPRATMTTVEAPFVRF